MIGVCLAPDCLTPLAAAWPPACQTHWWQLSPYIRHLLQHNAPRDDEPEGAAYAAARLVAVNFLGDHAKKRAAAERQAEVNRRIMGERE